jgi:cobalt-zinc-cadmium efflux system outer membrane protein
MGEMFLLSLASLAFASAVAAEAPEKPPRPSEIPLTADAAVEVALSRAPALQAARARAAAEKAEARASSRPEEPRLTAYHESGRGEGRTQMALTFDLWSLIGTPGRRRAGKADIRRADALLAESALALAARTRAALYEVQAASAAFSLKGEAADALEASAGASDARRAEAAQARADAVRAEAALEAARSRLAALMKVPVNSGWWTLASLPAASGEIPDAGALAALARERRPALKAALEAARSAVERASEWSSAAAGELRLGVESEKQPDGSRLTGPAVEMAVPLFATMVPRLEAAQARGEQARAAADETDAELMAELEVLRARLIAARRIAELCRDSLIPARERLAAASHSSEASAALLSARLERIEAQRDYWTTRAALEGAVGGSIEAATLETK